MGLSGRCSCGEVRYAVRGEPLATQACHCVDCQRTTGSAFVIHTIVIETDFEISGTTAMGIGPTGSGAGCELHRCVACGVIVWVRYRILPVGVIAIRAGTLDDPNAVRPLAHIFTSQRPSWVVLPDDVPVFDEGTDRRLIWPRTSIERYDALPRRADA